MIMETDNIIFLVDQLGIWEPKSVWNSDTGKTLPVHIYIAMSVGPQRQCFKNKLTWLHRHTVIADILEDIEKPR